MLVVPGEMAKLEPAVPKPTDVYSNLKASLTLEAIQLELFIKDSALVRRLSAYFHVWLTAANLL